jgi:hypothetical protein
MIGVGFVIRMARSPIEVLFRPRRFSVLEVLCLEHLGHPGHFEHLGSDRSPELGPVGKERTVVVGFVGRLAKVCRILPKERIPH